MDLSERTIDLIYRAVPPLKTDEEAKAHLQLVIASIMTREDVSEVSISLNIDGRPITIFVADIRKDTSVN